MLTFSSMAEWAEELSRLRGSRPIYLTGLEVGHLGDEDIPPERLPFVRAQRAARKLTEES